MRKGVSSKVMNRGGARREYMSLIAKRPLTPADICRLEALSALLIYEKTQHASK